MSIFTDQVMARELQRYGVLPSSDGEAETMLQSPLKEEKAIFALLPVPLRSKA